MSQSDDSARPTAVFVGLGAMGAAMAERIGTSGGAIFSDLVLYNRTPAKADSGCGSRFRAGIWRQDLAHDGRRHGG